MNKLLIAISLLVLPLIGWTQNDTTSTGEIVTGEVVIEKEKKIVLPKADKRYQKGQLKKYDSTRINIRFRQFEPSLEWPPYKSDIPFVAVSDEYPSLDYTNYLKLGYGNYNSPLIEVGVHETLGKLQFNSRAFYESFGRGPVNDSNSKNAVGSFNASARYENKGLELMPYINFENRQYRFYGNTNRINTGFDSDPAPKVNWNSLGIGLNLKGSTGDIAYQLNPLFQSTNQNLRDAEGLNKESLIGANGNLGYKINETYATGFDIEGYAGTYDGGFSYDRSLFVLKPWVQYRNEEFVIKGGFNIASSKSGEVRQSGLYPEVIGEWAFSKDWSVYGRFSGGVEWNGLNELLTTNEFLDDSLSLTNIEVVSEFGGGIKGKLIKNMTLEASLMLSNLDNLPVFIPSASDSSRFIVAFDDETINRVSVMAELNYSPTNTSTYGASLQIDGYSVETLDRPWHLPTYQFKAFTSHNINEKLIVSGSILSIGGIKAPGDVSFGIVNLGSFIDAGLGVKYLFTERASAFIDVQNLLNNEYERYLGYPVRGITFKIGGQYRF